MAEKSENETIPVRDFYIRALKPEDRNWVADYLDRHWMSTKIVSRGQVYYAHLLPGFAAFPGSSEEDADPEAKAIALLTYRMVEDQPEVEIITINSDEVQKGVGTALIETVRVVATENGIKRIWVMTTNDNIDAIRFYQRRGFRFAAIYPNAVAESRKLKPQIPIVGEHSIPIMDEIEFEMRL